MSRQPMSLQEFLFSFQLEAVFHFVRSYFDSTLRDDDCFPFTDSQLIVLLLIIQSFATDCQNCFVELSLLQTFSRVGATTSKSGELASSVGKNPSDL